MSRENCNPEYGLASVWQPAAAPPRLLRDEVHVWRVSLDRPEQDRLRLEQSLADDELRRAARFRSPENRNDYVVAHAALRSVIAGYLRVPPKELQFSAGARGKPGLAHPSDSLEFNLTHSGRLALIAVARQRAVGVDIEAIRANTHALSFARRHFSPSEAAALAELTDEARGEAFYRCWTRKEAFLKARGEGLLLPLDQFEVSVRPGEPAEILRVEDDPNEAARWSLHDIFPGPGYAAAIAALGRDWHPVPLDWVRDKTT